MAERYIGLMSGTSMDGVDAALCEIDAKGCKLISALEYPFPKAFKAEILQMIDTTTTLAAVGALNRRLGLLFSEAVNALLKQADTDPTRIRAVGSHGQTLWHAPKNSYPFSMQLGDASTIAAETQIDVVSDFRSKDIALGGEGAPFAPAFHRFLFNELNEDDALLNLGGMANITLFRGGVSGFDIGPANVLMDLWIDRVKGLPYDKEGAWAREGIVDDALLNAFYDEPYFSKKPPKSTGRELFNSTWLERKLAPFKHLPPVVVQATLLELCASSLMPVLGGAKVKRLIVCGGGARNSYLLERMRMHNPQVEIVTSDSLKVDSSMLEAMLFAWLAYKRIHREPVELKAVTGAKSNGILGGVYAKD